MLFVACGGDDDSGSTTPGTSGNDKTAAASPTGGSSGAASSPTAKATSGSDNPLSDLQAAAKSFSDGNFKISYDMTTTSGDGPTTGSMTIAIKGGKSAITITGFGGQEGSMTLIDDGTNSYTCIDTSKTCIKGGTSGGAAAILEGLRPDNIIDEATKAGAKVDKVGDQTIAGRSAKCYSAKDDTSEGTVCLDKKSSFVVLVDTTDTDGSKMKLQAKSIADTASDDDFKPPYTVQSLGN
jgi:outer membrane lipoprotein-sorting protein